MNSILTALIALGLVGLITSYVHHALANGHPAAGSGRRRRSVLQVDPAACIGCGKCQKRCHAGAITMADHTAHIDTTRCRLCQHCIGVCPKHAIKLIELCETNAAKG